MRIGAVGKLTGVPVTTLKYYLREGLLPPGELTAVNQAQYSDHHVHRVRLIRAMIEVGGLSTTQVKGVLDAVDQPAVPLFDVFAISQDALITPLPIEPEDEPLAAQATEWVDAFIERHGFEVRPDAAARTALVSVLVWMSKFGIADLDDPDPDGDAYFDRVAQYCKGLAAADMDMLPDGSRAEMVGYGLLGTVLIDDVFVAVRRMADESAFVERYGTE